ncbi:hypothetical protein Tsubulata_044815 [Turnera subulata]|uniref:F-box domain-containing protein n=1 Tax=Turnera subulata TaxID=218843 RepID=A0A9Q0F7E1_9ROSI|nr:hypothetical protein Tsubulata_044815 [Turnera subulata]
MSLSVSSRKQKREESKDDRAKAMKRNNTGAHNNGLLVDGAKSTDVEQLVISRNMAAPNPSYLPPEIVEDILDLLPRKSIDRFRSVSKWLFSLLLIKFNVPKLLYHPHKTTKFSPSNYGIKSSDDPGLFTAVVLPDYCVGYVIKNRGYMPPELLSTGDPEETHFFFVGSCNGLVCLQVYHNRNWEKFVWNPLTSVCRKLPHNSHASRYGFGYDLASNDYKVFAATGPPQDYHSGDGAKVEIFSLKTGSWKEVENPDWKYLQQIYQYYKGMGLFLNGALHWSPRESYLGKMGENIAIAFDLGKEKFYRVPSPPNQISAGNGSYYSLGVVGEYLSCLFEAKQTNRIWVMKEYCNEASWLPFVSYTGSHLTYVCDFVPRSFKDGRYMMLQFVLNGEIHVLKWNNNLEESDKAKKYSKKIKFSRAMWNYCLPYTQTLTSPYAS